MHKKKRVVRDLLVGLFFFMGVWGGGLWQKDTLIENRKLANDDRISENDPKQNEAATSGLTPMPSSY